MTGENKKLYYTVTVASLLDKLISIKNIIEIKRDLVSENEIKQFSKELNISLNSSSKILNSIYLTDFINKIYSKTYNLISVISQDIIDKNYNTEDLYKLSKNEYTLIYQKKYA